jgi:hypothetical protein
MQISIDNIQGMYLLDLLKNETWWCATKLKDSINLGFKLQEERKKCKHEQGVYIGKKTCCVKCGSFSENEGESWILNKI